MIILSIKGKIIKSIYQKYIITYILIVVVITNHKMS